MAYRVHSLRRPIQQLKDLVKNNPKYAIDYNDAYLNVIKRLEQDPITTSRFFKAVARDLLIGFQNIHFTEAWSIDWYPLRVSYYKADPNGNVSSGEVAIFWVQEMTPTLSMRLNPGLLP